MSRRERILLIVGLVAIVGVVFFYYVWSPKQAEYRELTQTLDDRQSQLDRMESTSRQAEKLQAEYAELQGFIATVEAKLPTGKEVPLLLVQLERATRALGINLLAIRPAGLETVEEGSAPARAGTRQRGAQAPPPPPVPGAAYSRFPIKLTMVASYGEVLRLMSTLQDFPRLIVVKRLTVVPKAVPDLSVDLDVETYVLPKEAR